VKSARVRPVPLVPSAAAEDLGNDHRDSALSLLKASAWTASPPTAGGVSAFVTRITYLAGRLFAYSFPDDDSQFVSRGFL
jgi:hypothetical protein